MVLRIHNCTGNFWTRALFFFFRVRLQYTNLLGTLLLCPQNDLNLLLTLITGVRGVRNVHRMLLFHPFLYFLNICIDIHVSIMSMNMFIWMQCSVQLGKLLLHKLAGLGDMSTKVKSRNTSNLFEETVQLWWCCVIWD